MTESPREYDTRKTAPYDFAPACEKPDCHRDASHAIQCRQCADIRFMLCGVHTAGVSTVHGPAQCGECGATGVHHSTLYELVPLGAWLLGGAR